MAAATLDMREVRKSQRRHAALLSGVYPFGHPLLKRSKIIWNMQNQLVPKYLSKIEGGKPKKCVNLDCRDSGYGVSTTNACTQTEGTDYKASVDNSDKGTQSKSGDELKTDLENLLNSRTPKSARKSLTLERTPSQLSSTTSPEWEDESAIISRQESSKRSTLASSTTSVATNTATIPSEMPSKTRSETSSRIRNSALESSTRINFTADSTESKTLHLLPADWPGYMTRGFKFSYFQYYSK